MRSRIVLGFMAFALAIQIIVSCDPQTPVNETSINTSDYGWHIYRYIDQEAGVVCWIEWMNNYSRSISCLPLKDTLLGKK